MLNGSRLNRNQTAGQDETPLCILFNNLPQRQVCSKPCYHGTLNCCMQWKKSHRTKPRAMPSYSNVYCIRGNSVSGREREVLPCQAIPPELFITAKVHHFHLQRQGFETNLPRINQFAFFIKWLAVLLKELLRTKGSWGNYLQNWCQGWSDR